ncbi:TetR/AcrR family transcriptional regulator [Candidatus Amarolinea aalborgensis]|uniref:TetR/AcrR family transcriptional regulator n=1 Tax=Candidatus Amarolinea aalborgensis TaxID=2249329 RepID=UPI003BF9C571
MSATDVTMPERILEGATHLFVTQGYHRISMREIAEAVGVSKAGLYYHFKDKEDLLLAILTAYLDHIERLLDGVQQAGGSTRSQVTGLMQAIFAQAPEQRAIIRLASQEMLQLSQEARARFGLIYHQKFIAQIEAILQRGMSRGELRPMDVHLATWILLGMMYPFFYPAHANELGAPAAAIDLMLEVFFDGAGLTP